MFQCLRPLLHSDVIESITMNTLHMCANAGDTQLRPRVLRCAFVNPFCVIAAWTAEEYVIFRKAMCRIRTAGGMGGEAENRPVHFGLSHFECTFFECLSWHSLFKSLNTV